MDFAGIYMILNLKNNKFYVGSSNNISKRIYEHYNSLKNKKHYNKYLQRAFNKNKDHFVNLLIEKVDNIENLLIREQYWIDELYACNNNIAYNLSPTAGSNKGIKRSEKTKKILSELKKGKNHHNYGKHLPEKTKLAISKGNKGKVRTEENKEKLRQINLGRTHSQETKTKISNSLKNIEWPEEHKQRLADLNRKIVLQYDLNNNLIKVWGSGAEAARQLGLKREFIYRVCRGLRNKYHGFVWKYQEDTSF